jgi:hypothetical protein
VKTATVVLLGIAAIGVTVVAVTLLKPKTPTQNPAPGAPTAGAGSWLGVANGLIGIAGTAFKTFGSSGSPKPTTPGQLGQAGDFYTPSMSASDYA